jgi:uncharacterized membrane protein YpjA
MVTASGAEITGLPSRRNARIAGLLYLLAGMPGPFAYIYTPRVLFVPGNPAATMQLTLAHADLLRAAVVSELVSAVLLILAASALHRLLASVDRWQAGLMLLFASLPAAMVFANATNQLGALSAAQAAVSTSGQSNGLEPILTTLLMQMHARGVTLANIFWGLWLVPLGLLVAGSGFMPRWLGYLLVIGGCAYAVESFTIIAAPNAAQAASVAGSVLGGIAELAMILWLLIWGVRQPPELVGGTAPAASRS